MVWVERLVTSGMTDKIIETEWSDFQPAFLSVRVLC